MWQNGQLKVNIPEQKKLDPNYSSTKCALQNLIIVNLRGVSTNKKYCMFYRHAIAQRTKLYVIENFIPR